jgi:type II secretory pathway pseudopilin PulG
MPTAKGQDFMNNKNAFTIVELAIALVVMGLVIMMAVKGYNIVQNAKLKRELIKVENLTLGMNVFYDKYKRLPDNITGNPHEIPSPANGVFKSLISEGLATAGDFQIYNIKNEVLATWRFAYCTYHEEGTGQYSGGPGYVCIYPDSVNLDIYTDLVGGASSTAPMSIVASYELYYDDVSLCYGKGRGIAPCDQSYSRERFVQDLRYDSSSFYFIEVWSH